MIKVLTDSWGETLYIPLNKYLKEIKLYGITKDYGYKTDYNELFYFKKILKSDDSFDILFINSWPSIFMIPFFSFLKKKKIIFVSHGNHFPITFKYSLINSNNFLIKIFIIFTYPIFKLLYIFGLKFVDLYFVVHKSPLLDITKKFKSIYFPITIDTEEFKKVKSNIELDKKFKNIFYPTGLRDIKNPQFAFDLMYKILQKYNDVKFYIIKPTDFQLKKYESFIKKIETNIVWLDKMKRDDMINAYSADWDLVLGSFYPEKMYAILNTIELEAMACKSPIICSDINEIIFKPIDKLEELAYKIIEDNNFKKDYIKKNYDYVYKNHSVVEISKLFEKYINELVKK